ncbi:hypothetical protein CONPUDRAFT_152631 [Coniophora puteana RWD-64-598 SS2]|uniref:Uncharacterized protein n=1 Tax=Coniophora puteana (strain RWD-64-598) TaxID=741705 RepID=A0A5M3MRK6_CONPW|nr:uncharacterized protein CONPUDRAFT_152631 [Coniophora puteana RWD-64-598 SS2]EIW81716.1 hypothetical protein CONPUDRAFT_152631 [Coniophora puteana RWD-64-598 SS2]
MRSTLALLFFTTFVVSVYGAAIEGKSVLDNESALKREEPHAIGAARHLDARHEVTADSIISFYENEDDPDAIYSQ